MITNIPRHYSAFKGEITQLYGLKPGFLFLDLTLGDGGHTQEALEAGCRVVSFDVDPEAISRAVSFIPSQYHPQIINPDTFQGKISNDFSWIIINSNFTRVAEISEKIGLPPFDGIMVDLGPSQYQVLNPDRGFSFASDERLDMRIDKNLGVTAADLLAMLNEGELVKLLEMGDETYAKPIARAIVRERQNHQITSTKQLADLVVRVKRSINKHIHPATQTFMALRMAVNLERENIHLLTDQLPRLLRTGGILGIISFHSGEDRIVKEFIRDQEEHGVLCAVNKKPLVPSQLELQISARTRSAKLRLAKKNI